MRTIGSMTTKRCRTAMVLMFFLFTSFPLSAQNIQKGDYGYLYCHMSDRGQWTAFALSRDGYHYEDVLGGGPVMDVRNMPVSRVVSAMPISPAVGMVRAM